MPKFRKMPFTVEYLKSILSYDKETGIFIWKDRIDSKGRLIKFSGKQAGCKDVWYYRIVVDKKMYSAHRLAFYYETGEQPEMVDHINGDGFDNRISNLRAATSKINGKNVKMHRRNTSGVTGVCHDKRWGKWQASIHVEGKTINLGRHKTLEEAKAAREQANLQYGFGINHGR